MKNRKVKIEISENRLGQNRVNKEEKTGQNCIKFGYIQIKLNRAK